MRLRDSAIRSSAYALLIERIPNSLSASLTLVLALSAQTASACNIYGINHTHWAINRFAVHKEETMQSSLRFGSGKVVE